VPGADTTLSATLIRYKPLWLL